jgi:uncharacterized RmlC-like cupin family protein
VQAYQAGISAEAVGAMIARTDPNERESAALLPESEALARPQH